MLEVFAVEMVLGIGDENINYFLSQFKEDGFSLYNADCERFMVLYVTLAYQCHTYIQERKLHKDNDLRRRIVSGLAKLFSVLSWNQFRISADDMDAYLERGIIPTDSMYDSVDKPLELPLHLVKEGIETYCAYALGAGTDKVMDKKEFWHKVNNYFVELYGLPEKERTSPAGGEPGFLNFDL